MTRARRDRIVIALLALTVAALVIGDIIGTTSNRSTVNGADLVAVLLCAVGVVLYGRRAVDE